MTDPIIPARVYPAGTPLPPAAGSPPQPPPPLGPDFVPPWRAAPPPPPPAAPPPAAIEIHHVHTHIVVASEPEQEHEPRWERLIAWIRPRQTILGLAAAVIPMPGTGNSLATSWAAALNDARDTGSIGGAYVLAGVALGIALLINRRRHTWWGRALLVTALIGGTGALGWYDPVTLLTGVRA
ncbi:hypothetical protein ACWDHW_13215 [Streptomyces melanosporofaciens]|uniref:hypothetical protein n=1 Tax=Streptomyces sp. NPDC021218 TaxID=3365119 RepID=UPI003793AF7F